MFVTLSVTQEHEKMHMNVSHLPSEVGNLGFSINEMTGCTLEDWGSIPVRGNGFNLLQQSVSTK